MNGFINAFFSRPYAVLLALIIIVIFGSSSFVQMPKEATPDIDIPMAYISVGYEGITPTDAEKLLAKPLEKHLRTVAGLDKMTSASAEGYSSVTLEFDAGENIDLILDDVREAVDAAKPDLPNEADEPKIYEINISKRKNLIVFEISANAFLLNMVRIIVGTLLEFGIEEKNPLLMKTIVDGRDRNLSGKTISANGLYFVGPEYPSEFKIKKPPLKYQILPTWLKKWIFL